MFITGYKRTSAFTAAGGDSAYIANSVEPDSVAHFSASPPVYWQGGTVQAGLSDIITFARTGVATYVDSSGNIQEAATGVARVGHYTYNGSTYDARGLRFEDTAATNLRLNSEGVTDLTANNGTMTAAQANSPLGTNNAAEFYPTTDSALHYVTFGTSTDHTYDNTHFYTHAILLKERGAQAFATVIGDGNAFHTTKRKGGFDLDAGTTEGAETDVVPYIENLGNGWFYCSISIDCAYSNQALPGYITLRSTAGYDNETYVGVTSDGVWFDGCMHLDHGTSRGLLSSYIATSGSTATRNAETASIASADATSFEADFSGAMHGTVRYLDKGTADQILLIDRRTDANNRVTLSLDTDSTKTGTLTFKVVNGGTVTSVSATAELTPSSGSTIDKAFAVAFRAAESGSDLTVQIALNGTAATATTNTNSLPTIDTNDIDFGGMGSIALVDFFASDIGQAGIVTASNSASYPA